MPVANMNTIDIKLNKMPSPEYMKNVPKVMGFLEYLKGPDSTRNFDSVSFVGTGLPFPVGYPQVVWKYFPIFDGCSRLVLWHC